MGTALIGLLGVLVGISINEWLRKRNRIETYAARVFDKRLEIYEEAVPASQRRAGNREWRNRE
jgi:xanthosine utilization system XapX-like protein